MTDNIPSIDYNEAIRLMLNAKSSDTYQKLLLKLKATSYQEIIGASTKELPHSNMLAWIFSRQDLKNAPQSPISLLLRLTAYKASEMANELNVSVSTYIQNPKMVNDIILDKVVCINGRCLREDSNMSDMIKGRADILMERKMVCPDDKNVKNILLVIENKIKAKETSDQCNRYYDAYNKRKQYEEYEKIFVYLAPEYPSGYDVSKSYNGLSNEHFVILTYQELYDYVLRPLWMFRELFSEETVNMLDSYIKTLTSLKDFSNTTVMDKETKDLLSQFFEENKELILAAVQTSQDNKLIEDITIAVNSNATRSKYAFTYNGKTVNSLSRAGVFEKVVESLVDLNYSYNGICDLFSNAGLGSNNFSGTHDKKNYKDPITIQGSTWYMNVNKWTIEAFEKLLKLVAANPDWNISIMPQ